MKQPFEDERYGRGRGGNNNGGGDDDDYFDKPQNACTHFCMVSSKTLYNNNRIYYNFPCKPVHLTVPFIRIAIDLRLI